LWNTNLAEREKVRHSGQRALCHGLVEELEKLSQRDLVHAVDEAHFTDEEVENAASSCNYAHTRIVKIVCLIMLSDRL